MADSARVFLSYSSKDTDLVERLKTALADAGVVVWLDHEQLIPGTRNWQIKVREGIAWATYMVYAASETAALSDYVHDEINIARDKGKTVIPFWIRGNYWHDCVPLGFGATQHIDARDAAYAAGLAKLLATLGFASTAPAATIPPTPRQPLVVEPQEQATSTELIWTRYVPTRARPVQIANIRGLPPLTATPDVPKRLAQLGFRGINRIGTPAIIPPLVSVAAGPFLMGSDEAKDKEAHHDELPQHRVELAAFQIGKYPVTVTEYALAVQAGAVLEPPKLYFVDEEYGTTWQDQLKRLDHPVVNVSWHDVQAYIAWLRNVTGESDWRLPSEAEWEKAARWDSRANASRIYPWGDSFDKNRCNTLESGIGHTTPVGSYPAADPTHSGVSPWGVEDMAGNVWEWTSSLYTPYKSNENDGGEDRRYAGARTVRGACWWLTASIARAAFRSRFESAALNGHTGFRLALSASAGSAGG